MGLGKTVRSEDCSCFLKSLEVFAAGLSHQGLGGARDIRSFTDGQCWGLSAFGSRRKYGSVLCFITQEAVLFGSTQAWKVNKQGVWVFRNPRTGY